jgi:hypothetical protein
MTVGGLAGLFDTPAKDGKRKQDDDVQEKRVSLRKYEHPAAQCLDCQGVSPIHECSHQHLWKYVQAGNKGVHFLSEFCSDDLYRKGVAGSRHAETMCNLGEVLSEGILDKLLKPEILKKVRTEFDAIKPSLALLNGGKTSGGNSKSFQTLCKAEVKQEEDKVQDAAGKVHDWLSDPEGAVHGFLQIMSWGGISYVAMCSDKVARCAIDSECGKITKEQYKELMVARLCGKEGKDGALPNDDRNTMKSRKLFG